MEEDIKILEEKIHKMVTGIAVYRGNDYIDLARIMEREKQALENLIKRYRELEEYIKRLDKLNARDFVFKSEIQEKIEELKAMNLECETFGSMRNYAVLILQELVEE